MSASSPLSVTVTRRRRAMPSRQERGRAGRVAPVFVAELRFRVALLALGATAAARLAFAAHQRADGSAQAAEAEAIEKEAAAFANPLRLPGASGRLYVETTRSQDPGVAAWRRRAGAGVFVAVLARWCSTT